MLNHLCAIVVVLAVPQLFAREMKLWLSHCGRRIPTIMKCVSCEFPWHTDGVEVHHTDSDSAGRVTIYNKNCRKPQETRLSTTKARVVGGIENKRNKVRKPAVSLSSVMAALRGSLCYWRYMYMCTSIFVVCKEPLSIDRSKGFQPRPVFVFSFVIRQNFHGIQGEV